MALGENLLLKRAAIAALASLVAAAFVLVTFPSAIAALFSPDETSFQVHPSKQADVIFLPPTSGVIVVRFEPAGNVNVPPGWNLAVGDPSVVEHCDQGCRIRFSLIDEQIDTQVRVTYLAGDSGYVNDIADSYEAQLSS